MLTLGCDAEIKRAKLPDDSYVTLDYWSEYDVLKFEFDGASFEGVFDLGLLQSWTKVA